jgi:hypothetical protein
MDGWEAMMTTCSMEEKEKEKKDMYGKGKRMIG